MLTRTERRLYGSVQRRVDHQRVDAAAPARRARSPRGSPRRSAPRAPRNATPVAATSATDGWSRRSATATTPRCRSKPTTSAITSRLGDVHGDAPRRRARRARVENRSTREGASSTERISWPGFDQPVDGDEPLGDEQLVALVRPPERLVVQRPVVVEARIVGVGERRDRLASARHRRRSDRVNARRPGESSANALNSRALPDGSRRNIVDCSPTSPANRVCGSMTNSTPAARRRSASSFQSAGSSRTPKCGTGTSSPSTSLRSRARASASARRGSRWATNWWP